jgi:phage/plasmid-like protein (TIGR03299 family)
MAHNINSMMYVNEKPWHGLGTRVEKELTGADALKAAGLDWTVSKHEVMHPAIPGKGTGFYTVMRDDTKAIFDVGASKSFKVFQNKVLADFGDALVATKEAKYHTAGALGQGEKVWMMAKMPKEIRIKGTDDVTEQFLLLTNGHDRGGKFQALLTPIRVVCQNTLNAALGQARDVYSLIHYGQDTTPSVEDARKILGMASKRFREAGEVYNALAAKVLHRATITGILNALIPLRDEGDTEDKIFRKAHHENILALFEDNDRNAFPKIAGSAWAFYNGITRYVDFHKNPFGNPEKVAPIADRASSILYGADAQLKRRALDLTFAAVSKAR